MRELSYDPLWKKLIDLRMKKTELAKKAGISRGIITRMGKNEMVTLDAVVKICQTLDCDVSDVLTVSHMDGKWRESHNSDSDGAGN